MRQKTNYRKKLDQLIVFCGVAVMLSLLSCAPARMETKYYLIDYTPDSDSKNFTIKKPFPYKTIVTTFNIPRSFDKIRIVARYSSHQINYYRYSLWAVKPQIAIADLLVQHINSYNIFEKCQREFLDSAPDYEINGKILQIERYDSEDYTAAHLKMDFELYASDDSQLLLRHEFDRELPIHAEKGEKMPIFAKAISDIVQSEADIFLRDVVDYFEKMELEKINSSNE